MAQMTWRMSDELLSQVKAAAAGSDRSLNEFVTLILSAATDPSTAGSEADMVRERLRRAGVTVVDYEPSHPVGTPAEVAAAGERLASGVSVADLVSEGR